MGGKRKNIYVTLELMKCFITVKLLEFRAPFFSGSEHLLKCWFTMVPMCLCLLRNIFRQGVTKGKTS
ncbi:hypothetical protein VNO77_43080 [Canavalia gladiata]|uniref:Uncharacterized protein n=1 Tax=Canavalia gladiata TaxID=3824 RepID=A0AAN9PP47_CANGL